MVSYVILFVGFTIGLNLTWARKPTGNDEEKMSKFLMLTPKQRMELIREAISKFGPFDRIDYQGSNENFFDYMEEQPLEVSPFGSDPELDPNLPYNIQNVRSTDLTDELKSNQRRDISIENKYPHFQPLCETHRRTVHLNDVFYDYRPNHYDEVYCVYPYIGAHERIDNNVCNEGGFHCIQLNRTIFVTKRAKGSSCWELEPRRVASGCECMWPKHNKGDIQFF